MHSCPHFKIQLFNRHHQYILDIFISWKCLEPDSFKKEQLFLQVESTLNKNNEPITKYLSL